MSKSSQNSLSNSSDLTELAFRHSPKKKSSDRIWNYVRRNLDSVSVIDAYHQKILRATFADYQPVSLESQNTAILKGLREDGIFTTNLTDLNLAPCLPEAQSLIPNISATVTNPESFCVHMPSFQITPNLFLWGLQPRLINLIENYFKLPVAYHGVYQRRDLVNPIVAKSRLWHIDMEDFNILKVIIYLNDVDEATGPFQYLNIEKTNQICQTLNYRHGYLNTEKVRAIVPENQWKSALGQAGTVIFVDTARLLHRGQVPTKHDRYTLFYDYTSRFPKRPYYCKSSLTSEALLAMSAHLSDWQLPFVFWREDSP